METIMENNEIKNNLHVFFRLLVYRAKKSREAERFPFKI